MKGISLQELAAKIEANRDLKHDYLAQTATLNLDVQEDGMVRLNAPDHVPMPILGTAHNQIGARLEIPPKYYNRMLKEQPKLLADNVNTWFKSESEKRMVRTLGGDVRAFLSDRYQRVENEEIAEVVLPILADIPDVRIVSCEVTERRLYIQAVSPRLQREVKKGDVVQAGVAISNSEIGLGSSSAAAMFWRCWCDNGAITEDVFRKYHVGKRIEDNAELWADDTKKADDKAILLKFRDMVKAAVNEERFLARIEKLQVLAGLMVKGDPALAVEILAKKVGASEAEQGGILRSLISGGDLSAWGLLNAVTHQAHTARSYDRAVEFEAAGGSLVELTRKEWAEVLEAA